MRRVLSFVLVAGLMLASSASAQNEAVSGQEAAPTGETAPQPAAPSPVPADSAPAASQPTAADAPQPAAGTAAQAATNADAAADSFVRITTRVEPKDVSIGSPFRFTLRVEAAPGVEVAVPVLSERLGDFAIRDFGSNPIAQTAQVAPAPSGWQVAEYWYDLVGYETGSQYVPSVPFPYRVAGGQTQKVDSPKPVVNIASMIKSAGGADDVRAIKEAVPIRRKVVWPYWAAAGVAGAALLGLALYRLLNRGRTAAAPELAPHEVALEALSRLRDERLLERNQHERYYVSLSDIVRRYLEGRFGLRAPEMTTDEFLAAAQRNRDLAGPHRAALQEFLAEADLVKFARHVPSHERATRAWTAAHDFVAATKPSKEPPKEVARAAA